MNTETDAQLVALVLAGDTDRYALLVSRYQAALFRYAVGMVRDSDLAADLVQDSFVKAYTSLASCQDPSRFGAWVFRILVNRCKDHLKSRRRHTVPLEEDTATTPDSDNPALSADRASMRETVERALASLPEAQREAFLLKHVEGRSYEEMAEMLDASVSALKMRVLRAREALQFLLKELVD
ncbi:MAG TPA: sigma-70 family RNA polymerase sigma factor [Longimicrobiaceae bacterium]|nr:sigma-70 family RNA polymerase sigma factor [Longimicrobiaceae bacterium]